MPPASRLLASSIVLRPFKNCSRERRSRFERFVAAAIVRERRRVTRRSRSPAERSRAAADSRRCASRLQQLAAATAAASATSTPRRQPIERPPPATRAHFSALLVVERVGERFKQTLVFSSYGAKFSTQNKRARAHRASWLFFCQLVRCGRRRARRGVDGGRHSTNKKYYFDAGGRVCSVGMQTLSEAMLHEASRSNCVDYGRRSYPVASFGRRSSVRRHPLALDEDADEQARRARANCTFIVARAGARTSARCVWARGTTLRGANFRCRVYERVALLRAPPTAQ